MIDWFSRRSRQESFVFEVTTRCNHDCLHCYNAWKNGEPYPAGELPTGETLAMLGKMLDETQARLVTLSGGEPLLRADLGEIVDYLAGRGVAINLICNGVLLDAAAFAPQLQLFRVFQQMADDGLGHVLAEHAPDIELLAALGGIAVSRRQPEAQGQGNPRQDRVGPEAGPKGQDR